MWKGPVQQERLRWFLYGTVAASHTQRIVGQRGRSSPVLDTACSRQMEILPT